MREAGVKQRLNRDGAGADEPGAICQLRLQEKVETTPIGWIVGVDRSALDEPVERLAGRIGIALQRRQLRPAAVRTLLRHQGAAGLRSAELVATRPVCRIGSSTEHEEQVTEMVDTM